MQKFIINYENAFPSQLNYKNIVVAIIDPICGDIFVQYHGMESRDSLTTNQMRFSLPASPELELELVERLY